MKALPLYQPYASLVALGAKRFETRHFPVPLSLFNQRIAIYATKGLGDPSKGGLTEKQLEAVCQDEPFATTLFHGGYRNAGELPRGAIVCTVRISGDQEITQRFSRHLQRGNPDEWMFGNYRPGRYAWVLNDLCRVEPIPCTTNHPGQFNVPAALAAQLGEEPPPGADQLTIDVEAA
jgi:hypothetical protein